ncbi:peptidoglycan-binding protein [Methanobrevibacter thaueri]|nr:peptidoglycan-binding protein [Methanobrevibacter thaueri]
MKYRKIMFMLVLAIFIFGAASVCASDVNDTVIASEDTIQTELSAGNENEIVEQASNDEVISEANVGTFQELQENITQGYSSGEITLDRDYECEDEFSAEGITIAQGIIINGQGHKIDAKGKATIFNIQADWVFLKNITFLNGKSKDGGAINWEANLGSVLDCRFVNNTATDDGGAIYWHNRGILPYLNSNLVRGCSFVNNTATGNGGGAIFFAGGENEYDTTVENCNFEGNSAPTGGAIYYMSEYTATVTDCNFTGNTATVDGGAVYFWYQGTVTNCNFTDNSAYYGGAVYFLDQGTVSNCNFTGNTASRYGGAVYFDETGNVTNCNFTDNTATRDGGAVYFSNTGNVTNCNFTNNKATGTVKYDGGGAVYFYSAGNVTNCNFTDNTATRDGGAVYFYQGTGSVTNCNFTNNKATGTNSWGGAIRISFGSVENCNFTGNTATGDGGAVYFSNTGNVTNCNFTGNTATYNGGAIWMDSGSVSNCNFAGNNATTGSAIYFYKGDSSDTLTVSYSTFLNNRANAGALDIVKTENNITITFIGQNNLLNAIYSRIDAEVAFTNVTYWGAKGITTVSATMSGSNKAAGQNITVGVVVNDKLVLNDVIITNENGTIVLDISAGENYYISARHDADSYYTEAEKTISNNTKFNVNVTSQTTTNKTVNITAKSNIYSELMPDKLLFILPNGTQIEATYGTNGTWWAVHKFDAYGDYQVNATYVGLDNVTITNATIGISKTPTEITIVNETVELLVGDSIGTGAALTPADVGELTFTSNNITVAKVEDGKIVAVGEGSAIITVSFAGNDDYAAAENKTINVKVIKYDSKVTIEPINNTIYPNNVTIKYTIENKTNVTVTIDGVSDDKIIITNDTITVIGLDAGEYTITILNNESRIYHQSNDTKTFTVNKQATSITGADVSTTYNINKELVITLKDSNGNPLTGASVTVDLNGAKTYTTDKNGQIKVSTNGLAPKTYTAKITFNGNTNYDKSTKDVKVTVKKATPKLTAKKKTFKTSVKTKKYTITLKDNTGKAIKKAKVTLKVKGKTYKATTNSKGKAVFKIKNLKKKGTFKATITYKGNKYYNKITKKANIKVIVTFKTVSKGSKDKSTVKEIQRALKDHGYYLSYKGHYLKVDGKFQSCTERSVKEFQHDKGLKVTGKVDEKTAKKLGLI